MNLMILRKLEKNIYYIKTLNNFKLNIKQIQMLIIFSLSIILYVNTWSFSFASDDTMMITSNKYTKGGFDGIKHIISSDAFEGFLGEGKQLLSGGRYRPLSQIIFNVEYSIFGLSPKLWHIQNTIFFAFSMLLLYIVLLKLFKISANNWTNLAFITTLISLSHPLNTEVIANIKSFDLILSLIFSFTTLYWSLKWYDKEKPILLVGIIFSLFLGILSKETALTFLAIIPLSILFFREYNAQKFWMIFTALIISIGAYFTMRISLLGLPKSVEVTELLNNPFLEATNSEKYATIMFTWWHYIQLYILPINLTHDYYPYAIELKKWSNPLVIISLTLYTIFTIWSIIKLYKRVFKKEKANYIAYSWLFFMLIFSISSNILVSIGTFMNERFIFIADIGWAIIISYSIIYISKQIGKASSKTLFIILIPILALLSLKTINRNYAWKDDYTLFTTDVKVSINSAKCNVSAGGKTYERAKNVSNPIKKAKMLTNAEKYLLHGIKIHPKYAQAYILLGNVYFEKGLYNKSFIAYQRAVNVGEHKDALDNIMSLGLKLHQLKEYKNSQNILSYLFKYRKQNSDLNYYISDNYLNLNKIDTAIFILKSIIKNDSTYDEAFNKLGEIYGRYKNNLNASKYYLIKAYEINPNNSSVCENLGVLNGIMGNMKQSISFFKKALELMDKPTAQIYQNISASYRKLGDIKNAEKYLKLAKNINN